MREKDNAPKPVIRGTSNQVGADNIVSFSVANVRVTDSEAIIVIGQMKEGTEKSFFSSAAHLAVLFAKISTQGSRQTKIFLPPGATARLIFSFLFSKKAFENVFAQAILDMRQEHAEALACGCQWKARWIVIRDHMCLCLTVVAYLSETVVKKAVGIWKITP